MDEQRVDSLRRAVRRGDEDIVARSIADEPSAARAASSRGGTLLLEAHERELGDVAEAFLGSRVSLDIHEACALGRADAVERVVTARPEAANERGPDGFFPLHRAAYRGHVEVVRRLIEAGADAGATTDNGARMTALHCLDAGRARFGGGVGFDGCERALLEAGADPAATMAGGHVAAITNEVESAP